MIFFWGITLNWEYLVLDMKEMKEEDIIKKALAGGLTDKEKEFLAGQEPVLRHLKEQWNGPGDSFLSPVAKERVLGRVMRKIHPYNTRRDYWMKYAVAASLALLISVGSWLIGQSGTKEKTIYVVSAGRQSMESFYLPDGSHVSLNAGGRLTYPESFDGERREVSLSGQAFFEVHHDLEHPFIVKTKSMDIKALGTAFEVFCVDSLSYAEMILAEGAVEVSTKKEREKGDVLLVKPDEKLAYVMGGKAEIMQVNADQYSSWRREGRPNFKNEKLGMILPRLESWYGISIKCPSELAGKYSFTFSIHDESLELLLDIISKSSPVAYRKKGDSFVLYEKVNK